MSSYEVFGRAIHDDSISLKVESSTSSPLRRLAIIAAYEAALVVASEVRIETVLARITAMSRSVVRARYAAIQQFDDTGIDTQFVCSFGDVSPENSQQIEPLLADIVQSLPHIAEAMIMPRLSLLPSDATANPLADQPALIVPIRPCAVWNLAFTLVDYWWMPWAAESTLNPMARAPDQNSPSSCPW